MSLSIFVMVESGHTQMPPPEASPPAIVIAPEENTPSFMGFTCTLSIHVPPVYVFAPEISTSQIKETLGSQDPSK